MIGEFINLFFPKVCLACGKSLGSKVEHICIRCRYGIPRNKYAAYSDNQIHKVFAGRLEIEKANAFLKFQKQGRVQTLLHQLKYKGAKELGVTLGKMMALEIVEQDFFSGIDIILPVPLHPLKQRRRGYNQSEKLAEGIAKISEIQLLPKLIQKNVHTASQTRKTRFQRWENVHQTFTITNKQKLEGKHILLVDDVLTTGATIEACANSFNQLGNIKISLLFLAYAD